MTARPPPPPPNGGDPEMMVHHDECPCEPGLHHEGGEAWKHPRLDMPGRGNRGRGPGRGNMRPGGGQEVMGELAALGVHFYPPPMLLRRAEKIGLTPDQMTKIRQEMLSTQAHAIDFRAKLAHAKIEITRLLAAEKIDEHAVDAQIDEAARVEAEMHKLHLGTMLRVRALLTPEQRQKLEERRRKHEGPKPGAGAAGKTSDVIGEADDDDDDRDDDDDTDAALIRTSLTPRSRS
jgi:Spy/CpxP family protein refolding chaperone